MLNGAQGLGNSAEVLPAGDEGGVCPPFVCVSAGLRRLLLQAEITGSRLQFAALEGEAGTGKHLFAQTLHRSSALGALPFRRRDAREWLATDADAASLVGTLYLDRVDLLAPAGQGLLLNLVKVLQDAPPARFLLLVSSHSSLRQMASLGAGLGAGQASSQAGSQARSQAGSQAGSQAAFLPDLAFRLTAVRFALPPLREHREDIAPITQALVDRICRRYQQPTAVLAPGTLPRLLQHTWPGNVRELASVLESAILDSTTGVIRPGDLALHVGRELVMAPAPAAGPVVAAAADLTLDAVIHRHIQLVLELNRGNKLRAARQLGISRSTLYRILAGETMGGVAERGAIAS